MIQYQKEKMNQFKLILFMFCATITNESSAQYYTPIKPSIVRLADSSEHMTIGLFLEDRAEEGKTFEKIEYGIKLSNDLTWKMANFFMNNEKDHINPFNRHDIDITVEIFQIQLDETIIKVEERDAFYYEEYKRNLQRNRWETDTTSFPFRVRFAVEEEGAYRIIFTLNVKGRDLEEFATDLYISDSSNPGYIELGKNKKHMRFSKTKDCFLGVGQQVPWATWISWFEADKPSGPVLYDEVENSLNALADAQGNYTRILAVPWFMQLEWEALGNYQPRMAQAWGFDRMDELCREKKIYYIYSMIHSQILKIHDDVPNTGWLFNCYNDNDRTIEPIAHEERIGITDPIEYFSNATAIDHQKNYFRYIVSRWGFSTAVAGWQLMNEIDLVSHYANEERNGKEIDNSKMRNAVTNWVHEHIEYIAEDLKDSHMRSVSLVGGKRWGADLWDPEIWNHDSIDYIGFHTYAHEQDTEGGNVRSRNIKIRYSHINNLNIGIQNGEISMPSYQNKMFIMDECGHHVAIKVQWPEDKDIRPTVDFNNCADFMFKQDTWFLFAAGTGSAGLDWWNSEQEKRMADWKRYLPGIQAFVKDIDFENVDYTSIKNYKDEPYIVQRWPFTNKQIDRSNDRHYKKKDILESYIQLSSDGLQGFGWMLNRSFNWYNLIDSLPCLSAMYHGTDPYHKKYLYKPRDSDGEGKPVDVGKNKGMIKIYNVAPKSSYQVDFFDTESGKLIESVKVKSNNRGMIKLYSPEMKVSERYDVAFKFYSEETGWR